MLFMIEYSLLLYLIIKFFKNITNIWIIFNIDFELIIIETLGYLIFFKKKIF
jgi:hypothetical protein